MHNEEPRTLVDLKASLLLDFGRLVNNFNGEGSLALKLVFLKGLNELVERVAGGYKDKWQEHTDFIDFTRLGLDSLGLIELLRLRPDTKLTFTADADGVRFTTAEDVAHAIEVMVDNPESDEDIVSLTSTMFGLAEALIDALNMNVTQEG